MRHAPEIILSIEENSALLQLLRSAKTPLRLLERAKIVFAASEGKNK